MRAWLDLHRIELMDFRPVSLSCGKIASDARFRKFKAC
jgi:hypothetical protein